MEEQKDGETEGLWRVWREGIGSDFLHLRLIRSRVVVLLRDRV